MADKELRDPFPVRNPSMLDTSDFDEGPRSIRVTQRGVAMVTKATYDAMVKAKDGDFNVLRGIKSILEQHKHLFEDPSLDRSEGWTVTGKHGKLNFKNTVPDEHGIYQIIHDPEESKFESSRFEKKEIITPIRHSDKPQYKAQYQKLVAEAEEFDRVFPMGLTHRHREVYKDFLWQNEILEGQGGDPVALAKGAETQPLQRTVDFWDNVNPTDDPTRVRPVNLSLTQQASEAFQSGNFNVLDQVNVSLDPQGKGRPRKTPIKQLEWEEKPKKSITLARPPAIKRPEPVIKKGDLPGFTVPKGREIVPNILVSNSTRLLKLLKEGERISGIDLETRYSFQPRIADSIVEGLQEEGIIKIASGHEGSGLPEYDINKDALWKLDKDNIKWIKGLSQNQRIYAQAVKKEGTDIAVSSQAPVPSTSIPPPVSKFDPVTKISYHEGNRLTPIGGLSVPKFKIDIMNEAFPLAVQEYSESKKKAAKKDFNKMWWGHTQGIAKENNLQITQQDFRTGRDMAFVTGKMVVDSSGTKQSTKSLITDDNVPVRMKPAKGVVNLPVPFIANPTDPTSMHIARNTYATSLDPETNKQKINLSLKNAVNNANNPRIRFKGLMPWFLDPLVGATIAGGATLFNPKAGWADVGRAAAKGANPFEFTDPVGVGSTLSRQAAEESVNIAAENKAAQEAGYVLPKTRPRTLSDFYYGGRRSKNLRDIFTPEEINELTDPIRKREGRTNKSFLD